MCYLDFLFECSTHHLAITRSNWYFGVKRITNVPVASSLLKQIIILTRVDNPASTMHIREMLIESKRKLLVLKGNITEFDQWVRKQMGRLHAREQEAVDLLYYLWKAYKAAPDDEFVVYVKDLKSQCDDGRATFTPEDLMVRAENKYEARLLDEENAWGKPTEEQEKIVAMTVEINSLKKERRGTTTKKDKEKADTKKAAAKKLQPRRRKSRRRKPTINGPGKENHPKRATIKKIMRSSRPSKARNIIGVRITTMGRACGPCITPMTVRWASPPQVPRPTPISPPSTPWTVIPAKNDCCTGAKDLPGSGCFPPSLYMVVAPRRDGPITCSHVTCGPAHRLAHSGRHRTAGILTLCTKKEEKASVQLSILNANAIHEMHNGDHDVD